MNDVVFLITLYLYISSTNDNNPTDSQAFVNKFLENKLLISWKSSFIKPHVIVFTGFWPQIIIALIITIIISIC